MSILLGDGWPVARKQHRCDLCGGTIAVGDRYHRQRLIWDGDPGVWKVHALCDKAYFKAARDLGLDTMDDEYPDWYEDVRPLVESFFAAMTP